MATDISKRIGISTHFLPATHGEDLFRSAEMVHAAGFSGFEIVPTLDQAQIGSPANHPNVGNDIAQVIQHCEESKRMIVGIWSGERPLAQRWNIERGEQ